MKFLSKFEALAGKMMALLARVPQDKAKARAMKECRLSALLTRHRSVVSKSQLSCWLLVGAMVMVTPSYAVNLSAQPKLQAIADQLIAEQYYSQAQLERIFAQAVVRDSVLKAMTSPAESKFTWGKYRKLFLKQDRIQQGVDFWQKYHTQMQRAQQQYGVPASVIAAIIGVESKFGRYKGKHKVLDSLVTLVVGFPRRSAFFAQELKEFLILTKENQLDSTQILGSYAGAVGFPQFISSSYRAYAVDFSGDGVIDLINQPVDAIGSVANYFVKNGWLTNQPVTSPAHLSVPREVAELANRQRKIKFTGARLRQLGAQLDEAIADTEKLNVLQLDVRETINDSNTSGRYIVRAGDTACQIAQAHKVSCAALLAANKIRAKDTIYRGQKLILPTTSKHTAGEKTKWSVNKTGSETAHERYFYTHENFYVITRYNHSVLYAMAVHDLSLAIEQAMRERVAGN